MNTLRHFHSQSPERPFAGFLFQAFAVAWACLFLAMPASAAVVVLAGWDVSTLPGGTNSFGTSPLTATTTASNLSVGGLTRGNGVGATGTAVARGWGGNGWASSTAAAAMTANDTATFTIAANSGYQFSLSSISHFSYRRSSSGPASGVLQYQVGTGAFNDISTLSYSSTSSSGASLATIDMSNISDLQNISFGTTVTFRVINYSGNSGGTWYVYDTANTTTPDLELSGTVSASGPATDGACGSANGQTFAAAPTTNFCSVGTASSLSGSGPWTWTCSGASGGNAASCSANTSVLGTCP
jgi:hypothetical protein